MYNGAYGSNRAYAEIFTQVLIKYECYRDNGISKIEYEAFKNAYLYDRNIYREIVNYVRRAPECLLFSDQNKTALDVLNDLVSVGAISSYEYNTLKERHLLH